MSSDIRIIIVLPNNFLKKHSFLFRQIIAVNFCLIFFLLISGCGKTQYAPILDGWKQPAGEQGNYTVQRGDTLYSIAWAFDMDFRDLAQLNHLRPPYDLRMGQVLRMSSYSTRYRSSSAQLSVTSKAERKHLLQLKKSSSQASENMIKSSQASVTTAQVISGTPVKQWLWPVQGRVVRGFSPTLTGNKGIDITGHVGEPIVAAAAGKVVYSGSGLRGYGNLIIIKHNDDYLSAYAYNQSLLVKENMHVNAGQKIALMGRNPAGKPMLHFEIRFFGKPVNPLDLLRNRP